ncbi:MAG: dihydroneopterin aldolase [Sphingobacteriaceae bacterium]|nr:dihydroneopterin aldolase [Sphingobacteriaceae bacterium]
MGQIKQKIALEGIRFFARHGFYPEEQKVGNEFMVTIETEMFVVENLNDELSDTVNYERLFEIASQEMKTPSKLLETVAHKILKTILAEFSQLETATVSIRKMNLPVKGEVKNSLVQLTYTR